MNGDQIKTYLQLYGSGPKELKASCSVGPEKTQELLNSFNKAFSSEPQIKPAKETKPHDKQ